MAAGKVGGGGIGCHERCCDKRTYSIWQAGVHEVLGAQYGGKTLGSDGKRKIEPALINCRNDSFFKAQQYGRWIVLNRENPTEMLGEQVCMKIWHSFTFEFVGWYRIRNGSLVSGTIGFAPGPHHAGAGVVLLGLTHTL